MKRQDPTIPVPIVRKDEKVGIITGIRKYKLITPLYGGGEEPAKPDSITVVRATEVRGHLRFWWRATRGGSFDGDLQKMKKREEEIWGSSGEKGKPGPSPVSVALQDPTEGKPIKELDKDKNGKKRHIGDPGALWSYVAFPLRDSKGEVREGVSFSLEIKYPGGLKDDVEAALWAWEIFGGIGARTRRGFGALQRTDNGLLTREQMEVEINNGIKKHVVIGIYPAGVPNLSGKLKFKVVSKGDTSAAAWEYLFKKLKDFRQDRNPGSSSRFGRSRWPEPDAIRRVPGMTSSDAHAKRLNTVDKFPRAKFGLPIIFQFKDEGIGDPKQTSLEGQDHDRLASPLILRPIACSDGALGLAAILEWEPVNSTELYTPPGGLILKGALRDPKVYSDLTPIEAATISPLNGETDIFKAFLKTLT
jgi:CRISPR-associated protein Cmr1